MSHGTAAPGSDEAIRRGWLLLRDPFATPTKGVRLLLLLAWLAWFPPRQWGEGVLLVILPACVAVIAGVMVFFSFRMRRRAALGPDGRMKEELHRAIGKFRGMETLLLAVVALLFVAIASGLWLKARSSRALEIGDAAIVSMGALIIWGTVEMTFHHRRAARYAGMEPDGAS